MLLVASLVGGWLNLPLWRLPPSHSVHAAVVSAFGVRWLVPVVEEDEGTIVAINVGGALIPTGVSARILANDRLWWRDVVAAAIVCAVVHRLAEPVAGLGIAVPALAPPITAALASLALSQGSAAPGAFVAGTLGTLVGADLLNLPRVRGLGTAIASIGGAGTFDGVFLSGVLGVVLAASL